jgi:osmotically-inducible protein OsmY
MQAVKSTSVSLAMLMTALLSSACDRGPDPKDRIERELDSASINDVNVDYDRSNSIVHLKGEVDNSGEKSRAEQIAQEAVGTSGRVANELTVKGIDDKTADDMDNAIRRELNAKVENDRTLNDRGVNFDVNNGVVTIKGEVRTDTEKAKVAEMAKTTQNVRDVVNALEIDPTISESKSEAPSIPRTSPPAR